MGYLIHILLALACLGIAEEQPEPAPPLLWGQLLLGLIPYAVGLFVRRQSLRGRFRSAEVGFAFLHWSPPFLYLASLLVFGWLESVEGWAGTRPSLFVWPDLTLLLALAPFVAFALLCIDVRARLTEPRGSVSRARRFHARLFLSGLAPILMYVVIAWAVGLMPTARIHIEEVRLYGVAFGAALVVVFVLALPSVLASTWTTEPLPSGVIRELFMSVARRARFTCRHILVWHTGRQMANAAIVGLVPRTRLVLFSDALLDRLSERELAAVFAHEIGHAKRGHVLAFGTWALALFFGADLIVSHFAGNSELGSAGLLAVALVAWGLVFGWMSRRCELDADLFSLETVGDADALVRALEAVGGLHSQSRGSWRHFSTLRRIAFLRAAEADPAVGLVLRARLRRLARLGAALAVAVVLLQARDLAASYGPDRVRASLRMGRWSEAGERLGALGDADEDLARLVDRALTLPDAEPATIVARVRDAFRARDAEAAADWLRLGAMHGDPELVVVEEAFWLGVEQDTERAQRLLEREAPTWAAAVERFFEQIGPPDPDQ